MPSVFHLTPILEPGFERRANRMIKLIRNSHVGFEAIAFSGLSGALIVPLIASELKCYMIAVRKKEEAAHSDFKVECPFDLSSGIEYIIVDDQISSGKTVKHIIRQIDRSAATERNISYVRPMCKGIFLYLEHQDQPEPLSYGHTDYPIMALKRKTYAEWEISSKK